MQINNCVLIGAGNLATQIAAALQAAGIEVQQIYSRTEASARALAEKCGCAFTTDADTIFPDADLYLYAVKDDALPELVRRVKTTHGIHAHTAGSVLMQVFEGVKPNFGVLYPLQTFSKNKVVSFGNIPIFIEANSETGLKSLRILAEKLSDRVGECNSAQRQALHLAAVFCCNFSNHLFHIASLILAENKLPFDVMLPLIGETVAKVQTLAPAEAQTGPAVRYDTGVITKHLQALREMPDEQQIYDLISKNIHKLYRK